MPIDEIINTLEAERNNLTRAIEALRGSRSGGKAGPRGRGRRRLSAAARKKISDAMRRTWAARKKKEKVA